MDYQPYTNTYLTTFAVILALTVTSCQGGDFLAFNQMKNAFGANPSWVNLALKVTTSVTIIIVFPGIYFGLAFLAISGFPRPSPGDWLFFVLTMSLILFLVTPAYAAQQLWLFVARGHWVCPDKVGQKTPVFLVLVCGVIPLTFVITRIACS